MKYKKRYYFLFIIFIIILIFFSLSPFAYGAYPKLISKLTDAFDKIASYIVAIATPAAGVAIGSGFLMQKFSFGDEERIRIGKKLVRTSIISYAFILLLELILTAIQTILT